MKPIIDTIRKELKRNSDPHTKTTGQKYFAVSLIIPSRRGKFLQEIFGIADILLMDDDNLVQKGCGWMLKAASQSHQKEVFNYVLKNKEAMPRTALRYAIEKMPAWRRKMAMAVPKAYH